MGFGVALARAQGGPLGHWAGQGEQGQDGAGGGGVVTQAVPQDAVDTG